MRINSLTPVSEVHPEDNLVLDSPTGTKALPYSALMQGVNDGITITESISDEFSETKDYAIGDYCIYLNRLYKFTAAKSAGAWDATKLIPCTVSDEILSLRSTQDLMWQFTNANAKLIPANTDMETETYTIPGVYTCNEVVTANTLLNCPTKRAFTLFVYKPILKTSRYVIQEFRPYEGDVIYKRLYYENDHSFGELNTYTPTGFLKFKRFTQQVLPQSDLLLYLDTVVAENSIELIYVTVGNITGIPGFAGYSGGLAMHLNDTITIAFFSYNGSMIFMNTRNRSSSWGNWKKFTGVSV